MAVYFTKNNFTIRMNTFQTYSFTGKRTIVRVDFNVPMDKSTGLISDDKRIRAAAPTLKHILDQGGSVVLLSHFGRPKNGPETIFSLEQICAKVSEVLGVKVKFAADCISHEAFLLSITRRSFITRKCSFL